jgi:hypothetical protein
MDQLMNAMRDKYAREAEDEYNAYRMREDGPEGYYYSDNVISRALRELEQLGIDDKDVRQREYMERMMREYGPRHGVGRGLMYPHSYERGRMDFIDKLNEVNQMDDIGKLRKFGMMLGDSAETLMQPPSRRRGYASGLLTYLFGDRDELY